jgi:RHS repeat-associated protein
MGWRLGLLRIERRTDRGIPNYDDTDTFAIGDGEELVPVGSGRYRPRTDTKFWSIQRDANGWTVRTGDGIILLFGQTPASRESDGSRVFSWLVDEQHDPAGNVISYKYLRDGGRLYPEEVTWSIFTARYVYEARADVLRNGRAGFLRTTALRAHSVEILSQRAEPALLRTYLFEYHASRAGLSQLVRVSLSATAGGETADFPALSLTYADFDLSRWHIRTLWSEIPPPGAENPAAQWVDLTGDGLPDLLSTSEPALLWRNNGDGWLDGPLAVTALPAAVTLSRMNVAFADLNGDGRVDLFAVDQPLQLAYTADGKGGFLPDPVVFRDRPTLRLSSADTRLMDVNGDGVTDLLQTGLRSFLFFRHVPGQGWQEPESVTRVADLDQFPDVNLADRGVMLADLTGDGLSDMFFLRSGQAWYWPNLGNGSWGRLVEMEDPPQFPTGYREDRIVVTDIDGDGCADALYLDSGRTLIWLNRGGAGFSPPFEIPAVPAPQARLFTLDLFGEGRSALVWSAPSSVGQDTGYRVLQFDPDATPYLLKSVHNGMGRTLSMEYLTSAQMRRADRDSGVEWPGILPFVVPLVTRIRDEDEVTGSQAEMIIRYHDGVYDGPRREFRGFSRVTVELAGDESMPSSRQDYTFFQGDPELADLIERDRQRARAGTLRSIKSFALNGGEPVLTFQTTQVWETAVDGAASGVNVFLPRLVSVEHREFGVADPDRIDRTQYSDFDAHGNPRRTVREWFAEGDPPAETLREEERLTFLDDEVNWLIKLPVRREQRDGQGVPVGVEIQYYDGPEFDGLAEGLAKRGLLTRSQSLALRQAALPAGFTDAVDFRALGYVLLGDGDVRGYYVTTFSVKRDAQGNIIGRRDPMGAESTFSYDADGIYPTGSTDTRGRTTTALFDPRACSLARLTLPDGRNYRWTFDPLGRQTARFEMDDEGNEQLVAAWTAEVASQPCSVTTFKPRGPGRLPAEFHHVADPENLTDVTISRTFFDGSGNTALTIASAADGTNGTVRFAANGRARRNARGLVALEYAPEFGPTLDFSPPGVAGPEAVRYRYDARGNLVETTGPGLVHVRTVRDTFSVREFEGEAAGAIGAANPSRIERFDVRGRAIRIEEAVGDGTTITTSYSVTADSRLEVLLDNNSAEVARYTFAGPGEAIRISHRDAGVRSYYRDARGLVVWLIAADGGRLHYVYDRAGRLSRVESQDPEAAVPATLREYVYDANPAAPAAPFFDGRLAVVSESAYTMRFGYDRVGREIAQTLEAGGKVLKTSRDFDLQGDLTAVVYPDGRRIELKRDRSGTLRVIPGMVTETEYDEQGRLLGCAFANGTRCMQPRDPVSRRLTEITAQGGAGVIRRMVYSYDATGNITGIEDSFNGAVQTSRYSYDGLHRLTGFETRDGGAAGAILRAGSYVMDSAGDLLALQETGSLTLKYGDPLRPGRLTQVTEGGAPERLSYDALGRVSSFGDLGLIEYDALDRVSKITKTDGMEIRLIDDHLGRPILREVFSGGVVSRVIFAGDLYEDHGGRTVRNVYIGTARVAREVVAGVTTTSFFLIDHHGTAILETDAAGAVAANQRYSPFGETLEAAVILNRYVDRERAGDSNLIHFGARMYSPRIGRFLTPDWYILENPDKAIRMPQGYNLYSYAMNNPLAFTDPSGRWFFLPFLVGFAVGLIYGYADGRGADGAWSLAKETAMTTGIGFNLGWMTGMVAPLFGGPALAAFFGIMGGVNGILSGTREIYDDIQFLKPEGLASLIADSSWGIVGTTLGNALNVYNLIAAPSSYRSDLSRRQNRQVYDRGFALQRTFAFTQGNTISNMSQGQPQGGNPGRLLHHESLHIFQNRAFGPLFQITYVGWLVVGGLVGGSIAALVYTAQGEKYDLGDAIRDVGYTDNPWEYWAYQHGGTASGRHIY